jgi:hypothetical protein
VILRRLRVAHGDRSRMHVLPIGRKERKHYAPTQFADPAAGQLAGSGGAAKVQTASQVQPWGLPPLPPGIGPVEKFADVSNTPQGQFLEGGAFDVQGNLWFVAIGSGWVSYLTPDARLVPVFNCNPPPELGQTCEPQGTHSRTALPYRPMTPCWPSGTSEKAVSGIVPS